MMMVMLQEHDDGDVDVDDDLLQEVEGQLAIVKLQQKVRSYGSVQPYILTCYKNGALEITNYRMSTHSLVNTTLLFQSASCFRGNY